MHLFQLTVPIRLKPQTKKLKTIATPTPTPIRFHISEIELFPSVFCLNKTPT